MKIINFIQKIHRILLAILLISSLLAELKIGNELVNKIENIKIDITQSQVEWIGRKVTGEHSGTIGLTEGWIQMDGDILIAGEIIIDMASISNVDIQSPDWRGKLETHLKSEDFFYVNSFPEAILKINGSQPLQLDNSANNMQILADLTIRGITHPISFPVLIQNSGPTFSAEGSVNIDRTLYNIKYKSGQFFFDLGDKLIYDEFTIKFTVQTSSF